MSGFLRKFGLIGLLSATVSGCSRESAEQTAETTKSGAPRATSAMSATDHGGAGAQAHESSAQDSSSAENSNAAVPREGDESDAGAGPAGAGNSGAAGDTEGTGGAGAAGSAAPNDESDAGSSAVVPSGTVDDANFVFDPARVQTYEIKVGPEDLARIDRNPSAEELVMASVSVNGELIEPVGFRYKGSGGAFVIPCTDNPESGFEGPKVGKCSMKIEFDEYDKSARYHGLKKLNLHSMGHDTSLMRERLGYALFRDMGVAASRAAYARIVINGQLEGVFLAVEQVDGRFTRDNFKDGGEGNLYKEVWPVSDQPESYRSALESNKGATTDVTKMQRFAAAIQSDPNAADTWLDREYMLHYIAVDRVIINDDGIFHWYCWPAGRKGFPDALIGNHNYYWYEDTKSDRMALIPWDLDDSFRGDTKLFIDVEWSATSSSCECHAGGGYVLRTATCDPLTAQLATWRSDYETVVDQFLAGPFSEGEVAKKLDAWALQARPLVEEVAGAHRAPDRAAWQQGLQEFKDIVSEARKNRGYPYQR